MASSRAGFAVKLIVATLLLAQLGLVAAQIVSMALAERSWLADLGSFVRPHLFLAGAGLALVGLLVPSRLTRLGAAAALLASVVPYLFLPAQAPALGGRSLTLATANILVDNPDPQRLLRIPQIVSADILVLQEMTPLWQQELIAAGYWRHESRRDMGANDDIKVFSRFPIVSEAQVSSDSLDTGNRHPLRLELSVDGRPLVVYAVHPQTPRSPAQWRQRNAYLRDLANAVIAEPPGTAVVIAGDWNTPSWSPYLHNVLSVTGLKSTESDWWPRPTRFSTRFGGITWLGTPIDRIVVSAAIGLQELTIGPDFGSNHLPVIARLSLP